MHVSIIIPALNESATIAVAVDRAWDTGPAEVIVVDGGSNDTTREVAGNHGARVLQSPRGRARQQNVGARSATGDVLLFLHADNWLEPHGLEQIQRATQDNGTVVGAFRQKIDASGWIYRTIERGNALRARRFGLPYGDQGIFVHRATFEQFGGFPDVGLMEDLLLMRKLRRIARPALLDGPLHVNARRWQKNGPIRQTLRNWSLLLGERLGISPDWLSRYYPPHDNGSHTAADQLTKKVTCSQSDG